MASDTKLQIAEDLKNCFVPIEFELRVTDKGLGLFAKKMFKKGDILMKEDNYFIASREEVSNFAVQISSDKFLDTEHPKYPDFVNHSCEPNTVYDIHEFRMVVIKDIQISDEITYDYETTEEDLVCEELDFICKCNSTKCRKHIVGSKLRPA